MKKLLLLVLSCCMTAVSNAETTDLSSYDNVIYIEPVSVHAGAQHTLSVRMKNSVSAEGFEFYLYLPSGISFNGDPSLSTARTTAAKTNTFNFTTQSDGALHVFAASTVHDAIIEGNDGEVALVPIVVDENMAQGDYTLVIKKGAVAGSDARSYGPDESVEIKTTITITEPLDNVILNETSATAPTSSSGEVNVTVNRTIKADTWSTICLPFDMTAAQVKEAFGDDVKLADFDSWSFTGNANSVENITMNFATATTITANTPCLIKVSSNISSFEVKNVEIAPVELPEVSQSYKVGKTNYNCSMYGYYSAGTVEEGEVFLSGNVFYVSTGLTQMKAFRATFLFQNITLPTNANARVSMFFDDDESVTGLEAVPATQRVEDGKVYSLSGQYLGSADAVTLSKGIYVVNNKKVVVKE